ncbi:hypothetical protein NFI96_006092 [Prochilodus magdalenae]|nr:hypothetical protein NFI96_006092 [Prochilodus magdalenae]
MTFSVVVSTESCLIKRLTKINRMDIVHLIETQMNKSVQEQTSRTYAEIERTLDHSEGEEHAFVRARQFGSQFGFAGSELDPNLNLKVS